MELANLAVLTSQDLKASTNDFNQNNLIGFTQFGRLFRGKLEGRCVSVKIWEEETLRRISSKYNDEYLIINEEVKFWTNPTIKGHPNSVTLIGYCWEKDVKGVVYDLNPLDTLHNIIVKDDLNWLQRINVIHELSKLLEFIHGQEKQNMIFNINPSHILLDKDYKPKLFDLMLLSEVKMLKEQLPMSTGYVDPYFSLRSGEWDRSCEVFSFGIIMLELITKRISYMGRKEDDSLNMGGLLHVWAKKEYKPNCSLVHKNLQENWGYSAEDGVAITELAMQCIDFFPLNRPTMKEALQGLDNLLVLQRLSDARPSKKQKNFISW